MSNRRSLLGCCALLIFACAEDNLSELPEQAKDPTREPVCVNADPAPRDCGAVALSSSAADDFAMAMDLCDGVLGASFSSGGSTRARAVVSDFGRYTPTFGQRMVVLASGIAADENTTGFVIPDPGTDFGGYSYVPEGTAYDYVAMTLDLEVPETATSLAFDFNFMTAEFPEYVGSAYNDTFTAHLEQPAPGFNGNVSFDAKGQPVTVNIGFFNVCDPDGADCYCYGDYYGGYYGEEGDEGCTCDDCTGEAALVGSGYEEGVGGGTGWLTTHVAVEPGTAITITFGIHDQGDGILDSAVLLDNFRWELGGCADGGPTTGR